ncbi:hypothetical protein SAMN05720762_11054, partial [Fibrobacter sp. UWH4]
DHHHHDLTEQGVLDILVRISVARITQEHLIQSLIGALMS